MRKLADLLPLVGVIVFFIGILGILFSYAAPAIGMAIDPNALRAGAIKLAGVGLAAYVVLHFLMPSSARR